MQSDESSGVGTGIGMLTGMLAFALLMAYCFCQPREEDEHLFDVLGGRALSRRSPTDTA